MRKVVKVLMVSVISSGIGVMPVATGTAFANNDKPPQAIGIRGVKPPQASVMLEVGSARSITSGRP